MAEGFLLQPSNNVENDCTFEDIGDEYFEILIWSSFFDGVKKNELDDITTFKMHDLVHDLAQAVVGYHECSIVKVSGQLEKSSEVRRLNIIMDKDLPASKSMRRIKKLRTIIVLEPNHSLDRRRFTNIQELPGFVTSLHNLQRLDLNHRRYFTTFPDSVTGLECLRFLDMSFTPIEKVPDVVTSLRNLRTLDVNTCKKLKILPEYVAGLKNLSLFNFSNCPLLDSLPKDFAELYQLRSVDLSGTAIKVLSESCANLYNLEYVNFGGCALLKESSTSLKCNDGIEELANLNFLEVLAISDLQNVKDPVDAEGANLEGKQNLHSLVLGWVESGSGTMRWDQKSCNFQVFEALQPPTDLRKLYIGNFKGWELPTWMCPSSGTLLNLEELLLRNCCQGIEHLPAAIRQLPRLRSLDLGKMSLMSLDIGGFPTLIQLNLADMLFLQELCFSSPLSCLRDLMISDCKRLIEIPSLPSLTFLALENVDHKLVFSVGRSQTSLTHIVLKNIEELKYFPISILENICDLRILVIRNCNQLEGFGVNGDENENENVVALYGPELYGGSLHKLEFSYCPVLKFLPDLRGWTSLRELNILNCPQVKESLTYDLKSLSFLQYLLVDFIQRAEQRGDPSSLDDCINLMHM
ncbi:putative disease resistance protein RGA3 [Papaver somniferum]|uniref:putative disease resistance protein RGA3 n=1 Tax=Papaver somniferum TaxID=3469 RepID=UPI000E7011F5|nr:putative disease resistance protein RGA3 [Papaver somniferum]